MNTNRKVLQVMPEFGLAGAEIMCENLSKELNDRLDYSVLIVSLYDYKSAITDRLNNSNIPIIYLNKKNGFDASVILKLKKIMEEEKIDIVHTHRYTMQYAIPAAILAGVKVRIHTVHNIASKEVNFPRRIFAKICYNVFNTIPVGISPLIQASIHKEYGLPVDKIPMIYNGIELDKCIVKKNYESTDQFKFIHIGRFNPQKNHKIMIYAMSQLKDQGVNVHLDFLGEGSLLDECKALVDELGLNSSITFVGLKDNVFPLLNRADCFILPSLYEGMPISLIEAMGTGVPVIVTNVGGMPDMVKDNITGLVIEPKVEELVLAMRKLINNQDLRKYLGQAALMKSQEFSKKNMGNAYVKIYEANLR